MIPAGRTFFKMSGSGNDFVMVDAREEAPGRLSDPAVVQRVCARGTGVGADGIVFLCGSDSATIQLIYLNADGSRAEFCGNATLCTTRLAVELGIGSADGLTIETDSGVVSAVRRGVDRAVTAGAIAGISLPVFWLGLVLQLVFANQLGWLPSAGRASFAGGGFADRVAHLVLPVIVLAAAHAAGWSRYLRSSMREALAQPFIDAARARGVREGQLVSRHALRYALLPFVTVVLLDASLMVSGAVVTESVFAWPGVGSLFTESLAKRDYTVLMAFLMCGAITVALLSLASDVVVRSLDPRLRDAA